MIDFRKIKISAEDDRLIAEIAKRAGCFQKRMTTYMDMMVVHDRYGLRLADLLAADNENFLHDIFGIARHLDRETGKLGGCFLPRFANLKEKAL